MDLLGLLYLVGMGAVFYLFFIRPQMKRQRETTDFQKSLKKGQRVVTNSGIHGKIVDFNEGMNTVFLDLGKTTVQIDRAAIAGTEGGNEKAEK